MGEFTNAHMDELNRMFAEMQTNRREHPELYCHHWELGHDLFGLLRGHAPDLASSPSLGLLGMRVEVNPYLPKDLIVCMDIVNGERKIVKIIKVQSDTTQEAAAAGRLDKTEAEETQTEG